MNKTYETLIIRGQELVSEYKFLEAFDAYREAKEIDKENPTAYISAAESCYLTKQYSASVALHIVGVLLQSKLPHYPSVISSHYSINAKHIANALLIEDDSLQNQIMDFLHFDKEQLELAIDVYKYSLLGDIGKAYYNTFLEILTKELYDQYQDAMANIGIHYIKKLLQSNSSKETIIQHFIDNINW